MSDTLILHIDGGSRGNPGPAAFGVYVPPQHGLPAIRKNGHIGRQTNNVAEYTGLLEALKMAAEMQADHVLVKSDSELLVRQMRGEYKVKNEGLKELFIQAKELASQFSKISFQHVYREQNKEADQLCNDALDGHTIKPASLPRLMSKSSPQGKTNESPDLFSSTNTHPTPAQTVHQLASITLQGHLESIEESEPGIFRLKLRIKETVWPMVLKTSKTGAQPLPKKGQHIRFLIPISDPKELKKSPIEVIHECLEMID